MKTWYKLKIANYQEQHSKKIQELAKRNPYPFKSWFTNGDRIIIPLKLQTQHDKIPPQDLLVIQFLKNNKFETVDYKKGLCKSMLSGGKVIRINSAIMGVIRNLIYQQIGGPQDYTSQSDFIQPQIKQKLLKINQVREIPIIMSKSKASDYIKNYLQQIIQYKTAKAQNILKLFIQSKYRTLTRSNSLSVVISQNPHDVAKASTERGWHSCITLPTKQRGQGGVNAGIVYCEVQQGGLVAYLISSTDINVEHPVARIAIRRFVNKVGKSYAIAQNHVYGTNIPGFLSTVKQWLNEKQEIPVQSLILRGGGYSDSYSTIDHMHIKNMQQVNELLNNDLKDSRGVRYKVQDNYSMTIFGAISNSGVQPFQTQVRNGVYFRNFSKIFYTKQQAIQYKKSVQKYQNVAKFYINSIKQKISQNIQFHLSQRQIQKCLKGPRFSLREVPYNINTFNHIQKYIKNTSQIVPQKIVTKILQQCKKGNISCYHILSTFANKKYALQYQSVQKYIIHNIPQMISIVQPGVILNNPKYKQIILNNLIDRYNKGIIQIQTVRDSLYNNGYSLVTENNLQKLQQEFPTISEYILSILQV